ncbi:MAG TPA: Rv3235 family protein, partial [Solirubrobacteraceae bacterium]|nr:Rv3235 family protein [Solirubrobacteraceae bacterium]
VRTCLIGRNVVDAAAVVRRGERASVLAIRVERHRGAWRVVEIARPEDGRAATVTRSLPGAPPEPDAFDEAAAEDDARSASAGRERAVR